MAADLQAIKSKVRRLTRSLRTAQLSEVDLEEYINTFILYDMPVNVRLFTNKQTLSFYTTPNIDTYATNTISATHPLYNFKNRYNGIMDPVFVDGYKMYFTQDRTEFYNLYPYPNSVVNIATGDGVTVTYAGTLTGAPILPFELSFTSIDNNGATLALKDEPEVDATTGDYLPTGSLYSADNTAVTGSINYNTGVYSITFPFAPQNGIAIYAHYVQVSLARPTAILFYGNEFKVRPVPDKAYKITMDAYLRPTELLANTDIPELEQWWQYIAYGAAKKVLEDRTDLDSIKNIMPEFKNQERLALRRTLQLQSNERAATIYAGQTTPRYYDGFGRGGL